ncbi:MAG: single-stranded DNA-binding protein [Deltaproteobacteria bacterium]|nr:single-stranded DNA-binding protein [Deltaproteobacteria bacterium]
MAYYNKVILMGNLTRDPELRFLPSGMAVCSFGLAVNTQFKRSGETVKETCFIDVTVFGKQAENVHEYLSKGRAALIEGRLRYRTWEDQDGKKRSKHEITAQTVQFINTFKGKEDISQGSEEKDDVPL